MRFMAAALIPLYLLTCVPAGAWAAVDADPLVLTPSHVSVNRTAPQVQAPSSKPQFGENPTDEEIFRARVFEEPLVPASGTVIPLENKALALALLAYANRSSQDDVGAITGFLSAYPASRWNVALWTNLGIVYRNSGWYSKALAAWEQAWALGKHEQESRVHALVDRAAGELARLNSNLGRLSRLETLLSELGAREVRGPATELLSAARNGMWMMQQKPELSFRCGPMALDSIQNLRGMKKESQELLFHSQSTDHGICLTEVLAMSTQAGMNLQMAKRTTPSTALPLPAVLHWKLDHYAAVLKEQDGRYLVQDPTFGEGLWVSKEALESESSGYVLIPAGSLPQGWQSVSAEEGRNVWGKGVNTASNVNATSGEDAQSKICPRPTPMADYNFSSMLASLRIQDQPVRYTPPRGPEVNFDVVYNQREANQPAVFSYSNLGPKWTFSWLSYVVDDPANPSADLKVFTRGGGALILTGFNSGTQSYAPELMTQNVAVRISPTSYELRRPDGSREVYSQPDGLTTFPRNIFLTQLIDPAGNAITFSYDAQFRLVSVTDAIGQVTTVSYDHPTDSLKITKVTDPFGRFATFEYNASGRLIKITDIIGIESQFGYVSGDLINQLITPYGTTTFAHGENSDGNTGHYRFIEATDPLGNKERVEMRRFTDGYAGSEPVAPSIPGVAFHNQSLFYRDAFYWDKKAMKEAPGDYTKAHVDHFLHDVDFNSVSRIKESEKDALEGRIWYRYPNQTIEYQASANMLDKPSIVARVLDDDTTQYVKMEYNSIGKVTKETDPSGRVT